MNRAFLALLACAVIIGAAATADAQRSKSRPKPKTKPAPAKTAAIKPAQPKQEHRFVTVDEFIRAGLPAGVPVAVEGYVPLGYRAADGSVRLHVSDSVDHILSAAMANATARSGATAVLPAVSVKARSGWGWTSGGAMRLVMFTGNGAAQTQVRDITPKIRITGWTAPGRATISPVTKLEIADDNGEYKVVN